MLCKYTVDIIDDNGEAIYLWVEASSPIFARNAAINEYPNAKRIEVKRYNTENLKEDNNRIKNE